MKIMLVKNLKKEAATESTQKKIKHENQRWKIVKVRLKLVGKTQQNSKGY